MAIGRPINLTGNIATRTISVTATTNQTEFTVVGGYHINQIDVFRNGVKLTPQADFQASDASKVILSSPANLNDEISFKIFDTFSVSDAIVGAATTQTINGDLILTGSLIHNGPGVGGGGTWTGYDNNTGITTTKKVKIQNDLEVTGVSTFGAINVTNGTFSGDVSSTNGTFSGIVTATTGAFSGIVTATTGTFSGDVSATTGTFSGDVSVGGTLTYEDVTNVDSVGLITARSGINVTGGTIDGRLGNYSETVNALGNTGANPSINYSDGTFVTATLDQTATFSFSSPPSGVVRAFTLQLTNGSGGPFSITWPGSVKWPGGSQTVRTTTSGRTDMYSFVTTDGGTTWYASISQYNYN